MTQVILPPGRIVKGHPMKRYAVTDDDTGVQKIMKNNELQFNTYIGYAILKTGETDWKTTSWGQQIANEAKTAWPGREYTIPTFAWKIVDGDSTVPNDKMSVPCEQEGFPGHWIVSISALQPFVCFHGDNLSPHQQIQDESEIKNGDYGQCIIDVRSNKAKKAGLYVDGKVFSLRQAGKRIVGKSEVDAVKAFAGNMGAMPTNMILDEGLAPSPPATGTPPSPPATGTPPSPPASGTPPSPGVEPAPDFVTPPPVERYVLPADGKAYTREQLHTAGYVDTVINTLVVA